MALDSPWSTDFCLTCDKQTTEGPYCSQACRSLDLDRASPLHTAQASPTQATFSPWSLPVWHKSMLRPQLPRQHQTTDMDSKRSSIASIDSLSSSSSSKSSTMLPLQPRLPDHIVDQLKDYDNCFANTRSRRRSLAFAS